MKTIFKNMKHVINAIRSPRSCVPHSLPPLFKYNDLEKKAFQMNLQLRNKPNVFSFLSLKISFQA